MRKLATAAIAFSAAVFAARQALERNLNYDIRIYDSNSRIGKKILVTGNGRCNYTNIGASVADYHGENPSFQTQIKHITKRKIWQEKSGSLPASMPGSDRN